MCGDKFLCQWLWHSLAKLCTKNYENPSIFVKVTAKKSVAPFFLGHGVYYELLVKVMFFMYSFVWSLIIFDMYSDVKLK